MFVSVHRKVIIAVNAVDETVLLPGCYLASICNHNMSLPDDCATLCQDHHHLCRASLGNFLYHPTVCMTGLLLRSCLILHTPQKRHILYSARIKLH